MDDQRKQREFAMKVLESGDQRLPREEYVDREAEAGLKIACHAARSRSHFIRAGDDRTSIDCERPTHLRQDRRTPGTIEQRQAKRLFQADDGIAYRGLCAIEPTGRGRKAAHIANHEKNTQLIERDRLEYGDRKI